MIVAGEWSPSPVETLRAVIGASIDRMQVAAFRAEFPEVGGDAS